MAIPSWLQDVTRAAQLLTRLSFESAAQASLILKDGSLYAYSGELPQPAAEELARVIHHNWINGGGADLARFVRLESGSELMVYATRLINSMALAVAYDVKTPFSKIRSQAGRLARLLASPPVDESLPLQPSAVNRLESKEQDEEIELPLPPLFDDVPPPDIAPQAGRLDRLEWLPVSDFEPINIPQPPSAPLGMPEIIQSARPAPNTAGLPNMEPGTGVMSSIFLSCTLITRMPRQHLIGELPRLLREWISDLCIAYGWRLESLSTGVEYLSWVVFVPPSVSPASLLKNVRASTSQFIYKEYPAMKAGNPSGDFWAPGYMVSSSSQLPAQEVLAEFITYTRRRQGLPGGSLES